MPKQSLVEKFINKHPNKDFYNAVKECFTGSWDSFSDNFQAKYGISVGAQTLRKYLEEGIEKGSISVKLPKAQKRGKASLEDKFKDENPNKDFNEALKECFDGSIESLGKNLKKKYKVTAGVATLKKYAKAIGIELPKKEHKRRGKASLIDKFNKKHPDLDFYEEVGKLCKGFNHVDEHIHNTFEEKYNIKVSFNTFKKYVLAGIDNDYIDMKLKKKRAGVKKNLNDRIHDFEMNVRSVIGGQKTKPAVIKCKNCGEEHSTRILRNCVPLSNLFKCPYCMNHMIHSEVSFSYNGKDYITVFENGTRRYIHKGKDVKNPAEKAIKADKLV